MIDNDQADGFVQRLTGCQNWLYAYILSLTGSTTAADDVLQNTNLVIWKKADQFVEGTDFAAWVCKIAYYQVQAFRRDRKRDVLLFDDEIVEKLAISAERHAAYSDVELAAFRECEKKLKPAQRELLHERYGLSGPGSTIEQLANRRNESSASIVSALYRIRSTLHVCVRHVISRESRT
jgi:RNA polymerase sigma-70 factor, ECF subfamily